MAHPPEGTTEQDRIGERLHSNRHLVRSIMTLHQQAKLNHLSFPTVNVAETAAFFEKYLGCEIVATGQNCLLKRNDFDIVLEHVEEAVPVWPKNFHFGLEVDTLEHVQMLYREFLEGGVQMETEVFNNTRGSRFFCRAPGGVLIEVNTREDMQQQDQWQKLF
jgi:catechol 2,3-dioxygenase-like lactoylglutathione lyase family enzyme